MSSVSNKHLRNLFHQKKKHVSTCRKKRFTTRNRFLYFMIRFYIYKRSLLYALVSCNSWKNLHWNYTFTRFVKNWFPLAETKIHFKDLFPIYVVLISTSRYQFLRKYQLSSTGKKDFFKNMFPPDRKLAKRCENRKTSRKIVINKWKLCLPVKSFFSIGSNEVFLWKHISFR